jgi:flagellar motor switch protein FliN/FliY
MKISSDKKIDLQAANSDDIESWQDFLDLPLELTVELGRIKMKLQAILDLKPDSLIQLKRSAGAGIDIIASNFCIARGEVVNFEDTIGIRVNEIIIPKAK